MDLIATHAGQVVVVHQELRCAGEPCCLHHPSNHPLNTAPLHWRGDRRLMERICEHGIGHPDPDDLAHHRRVAGAGVADGRGVHRCDGCCQPAGTFTVIQQTEE
jgi:hypothetical protein